MTEFDSPEVTLCGWQDVKIQLLTDVHVKLATLDFAQIKAVWKGVLWLDDSVLNQMLPRAHPSVRV